MVVSNERKQLEVAVPGHQRRCIVQKLKIVHMPNESHKGVVGELSTTLDGMPEVTAMDPPRILEIDPVLLVRKVLGLEVQAYVFLFS